MLAGTPAPCAQWPSHSGKDVLLATADPFSTPQDPGVAQPADTPPAQRAMALRTAVPDPPPQPPNAPRRQLWRWGAIAIGAGVLALGSYTYLWMAQPASMAVEIAGMAPVTRVLAVNGRIAAVNSVDIRAAATGRLIALPVAEGDGVLIGQTLMQIDAAAQTAIVRQAQAGLEAALVAQQQAIETYDRAAALGPNIAQTVLETDAHAVQRAAQEVARMTAALDQARAVLQTHTLQAPFGGTILTLTAELGQMVGPTTPLMTLADLQDLVVEADVDETYATHIALNQRAVLQLAGNSTPQDGFVSFVSSRVNAATGGLAVRITFDAPIRAPVGLTVGANIIVDQRAAALTIPRTALRPDADRPEVMIIRDGIARAQPVGVVDWPAARLIVTSGLAEGDTVIRDAAEITDGQEVVADLGITADLP